MKIVCSDGCKLTATEQTAIDYINSHIAQIAELSITDIAELAFVSPATVSRAIRKCGYDNLIKLRYDLISYDSNQQSLAQVNKILAKSYDECVKTIDNIHIPSVLETAEYIRCAKRIIIIGCGLTYLAAQEFEFQLQCQGYPVWSLSDSQMLKQLDRLVSNEDLVVILSVANSTPELAVAAELCKKQGAKLVVCCCTGGTKLEEYADVFLLGHSSLIYPNHLYRSTSRLALHIITRTITEYLIK